MRLGSKELSYLAACASDAARSAGKLIGQARPKEIEHKASGHSLASQAVTEVDRQSEELILRVLGPTVDRFELGLLAEEREDDKLRLERDFFWCIDPLDGTLPFIEGVPGYAVSIALVSREGSPEIGVVFDPVEGTLYVAGRGLGLSRNDKPWTLASCSSTNTLSVYLDRSFLDSAEYVQTVAALERVSREMGLKGVEMHATGGAVMNACHVLVEPPACYFKFPKPEEGGGSVWDFAATACLFREAGAVATDIHGGPLDLNRADSTFMNHRGVLFATDDDLAGRIRALLPG